MTSYSSLDDIQQAHEERLRGLDALVSTTPLTLREGDSPLVESRDGAVAIGLARHERHDPDGMEALWTGLSEHTLQLRMAGDDPTSAIDAVLTRWLDDVATAATPGEWEEVAHVSVPSRDDAPVLPLVRHGFAPMVATTIRRAGGGRGAAATAAGDVTVGEHIRLARPEDLDTLADLACELHDLDVRLGAIDHRAGQRELLRDGLAEQLSQSPEWTWVLEDEEGTPVGFAEVQPPGRAAWLADQSVAGDAVAYFSSLYLSPRARDAGAGSRLAAAAHARLDAEGVPFTLLHQVVPNPRSSPFWARMAYRPLWTTWQRRPLVLA